jgi:hypothetical protein
MCIDMVTLALLLYTFNNLRALSRLSRRRAWRPFSGVLTGKLFETRGNLEKSPMTTRLPRAALTPAAGPRHLVSTAATKNHPPITFSPNCARLFHLLRV